MVITLATFDDMNERQIDHQASPTLVNVAMAVNLQITGIKLPMNRYRPLQTGTESLQSRLLPFVCIFKHFF